VSEHQHPKAKAVRDMMAVIRAEFEKEWHDNPHNRRIRTVARALAMADGISEDYLDEIVMGFASGGGATVPTIARVGSRGLVAILFPLQPAWAAYARDAQAAIEAVDNTKDESS